MTADVRFQREIAQIPRLQKLLEADQVLPLRLAFERQSLDLRRSRVTMRGLRSIVAEPGVLRGGDADVFTITLAVPPEYPWSRIPDIRFIGNIPFHPHVWTHGGICWGTAHTPQPDLMLVDWLVRIVEYLQFNQSSLIGINQTSPANGAAMRWWQRHARDIARYVPPIDLARLRFWADQAKLS
ncbi:MAG: ubiquitin-conjugating enzyme E2 variant [Thermomicrobiales bacterium]